MPYDLAKHADLVGLAAHPRLSWQHWFARARATRLELSDDRAAPTRSMARLPGAPRLAELQAQNSSGGGSHAAFARRVLEAAAVGAGLTYDQVSGDLTQANYSSLQAGTTEFRRLCEQVGYGTLIPMLVRPIAERFHAQGALLGLWLAEMPDGGSHAPPAHETIDLLKDTTALIAQVRAGFVPRPEAAGSLGYDFRQVVELIREANALLDEAGLSLDTDPSLAATILWLR
ncbi:phage portal protein [Elioraea sp.]|uniref:phage portal protein n=1 Tax=Elioraea sp. TaxID=2185103 RepID=UPI0025BB8295|nr:phage portal protein [Elioraea sp.]